MKRLREFLQDGSADSNPARGTNLRALKRVLAILFMTFLFAGASGARAAPPIPPAPTEWVTDTAEFLSPQARQTLNAQLAAYEQSSGHQVLVWVGKTTGETPLEDWTIRAFQAWRPGRKGLDDGLVLFLFAQDRKARIEVGYGLEGQAPDAVTSRILREVVLPRIQAGDRDGAVAAGVKQLVATLGGNTMMPGTAPLPSRPLGWPQIILLLLTGITLVFLAFRYPGLALYLMAIFARGGGGGAGFGGGGGRSGGGGASGRW